MKMNCPHIEKFLTIKAIVVIDSVLCLELARCGTSAAAWNCLELVLCGTSVAASNCLELFLCGTSVAAPNWLGVAHLWMPRTDSVWHICGCLALSRCGTSLRGCLALPRCGTSFGGSLALPHRRSNNLESYCQSSGHWRITLNMSYIQAPIGDAHVHIDSIV